MGFKKMLLSLCYFHYNKILKMLIMIASKKCVNAIVVVEFRCLLCE